MKYDVTIIGGGPGGYVAAIKALKLGLHVALIEKQELGGTCLNLGCIPTKAYLESAKLYHSMRNGAEFGVFASEIQYDFAVIAERKNRIVQKLVKGIEYLIKSQNGDIFKGKGFIQSKNSVCIFGNKDRVIETKNIVIATGSKPALSPIPGINGKKIVTSDDILSIDELPKSILIVGGGVIGIEFASIFNAFGIEVTIVEMQDHILPTFDKDISEMMKKNLISRGVKIYTSAKVLELKSEKQAECIIKVANEECVLKASLAMISIGRIPNTLDIGLENLNIDMEDRFIQVDNKMRTNVDGVYAIGDVTPKCQLAHVASAQGLVAANNIANVESKMEYDIIPTCIYTSPEIASVGLTERQASSLGYSIKIGSFPVTTNGKSMILGEKEGLAKIISDACTGEILGAQLMCASATEMISEISAAMKAEATIRELGDTIHPHPSVSEVVMEMSQDVFKESIHKIL